MGNKNSGTIPVYISKNNNPASPSRASQLHWFVVYADFRFEMFYDEVHEKKVCFCSVKKLVAADTMKFVRIGLSNASLFGAYSYALKLIADDRDYSLLRNDCQVFATNLANHLTGLHISRLSASTMFSFSAEDVLADATPHYLKVHGVSDYQTFEDLIAYKQGSPAPRPSLDQSWLAIKLSYVLSSSMSAGNAATPRCQKFVLQYARGLSNSLEFVGTDLYEENLSLPSLDRPQCAAQREAIHELQAQNIVNEVPRTYLLQVIDTVTQYYTPIVDVGDVRIRTQAAQAFLRTFKLAQGYDDNTIRARIAEMSPNILNSDLTLGDRKVVFAFFALHYFYKGNDQLLKEASAKSVVENAASAAIAAS